jgi:biopolymer transport protein ExbD
MAANLSNDDEMITGINVTPLVDIVLVLLVILMVTASYVAAKTIPMDLPRGATGEQLPTTVAVSIDAAGKLYVDAEPVDEAGLSARVAAAHAKDADTRATIAADSRVPHGRVVQVIDILRQEDIVKFAINVDPAELASAKR